MAPLPLDQYHIGIICALHFELAAVRAMLDEEHGRIDEKDIHDHNAYIAGRMHKHAVIIACLPAGAHGTSAAATVAKDMLRTFRHLRFGVLVGIGSGIPDLANGIDIRLGDVVVSQPNGTHGGVVQCRKVENVHGISWEQTGALNAPPQALLTALQMLQADHELEDSQMSVYLAEMLQRWPKSSKSGYSFPGFDLDILYEVTIVRPLGRATESQVLPDVSVVSRETRATPQPEIHYGTIASIGHDVKTGSERDALRRELSAHCVETEAANLMNEFPCIVVRGISDYADAHESKRWDRYAAATAAAFTRELFLHVSPYQPDPVSLPLRASEEANQGSDVQLLHTIAYVAEAAYSSWENQRHRQCLSGTRVDLLDEITKWATGISDQHIYWLRGRAGTGKSTIAITIAQLLARQNTPLASFFFKRGGGDLARSRKVLGTIARQLSNASLEVAVHICNALRDDPDLASSAALSVQLEKLILRPLEEFRRNKPTPQAFVVVLDALDECDDLDDIRLLIQLFGENSRTANIGLKILVTSRPEISILRGFRVIDHIVFCELALHDLSRSIVDSDIEHFIKHELSRIRKQRDLPDTWPVDAQIQHIVSQANGLFIYAATVCRYIDGPEQVSPMHRFDRVCRGIKGNHKFNETLDAMYLVVLDSALRGDFDTEELHDSLQQLRLIMGCVVLFFDKLTARAVGNLLLPTQSNSHILVKGTLSSLQAVFDVPEDPDQPIQILHLSFRDFLVDQRRCSDTRFYIDQKQVHHTLATYCVSLMTAKLKRNMCRLSDLGISQKSISEEILHHYIPDELRYACRHWINHVDLGREDLSNDSDIHKFFKRHAIYWLEVMCLLGEVPEVVSMLTKLEGMIEASNPMDMKALIRDTRRFVQTFQHVLTDAPLQLYISALKFRPSNSRFRSLPCAETDQDVQIFTQVSTDWTACTNTFELGYDYARSVALTPDGTNAVAFTIGGDIQAWDIQTGKRVDKLSSLCQNASCYTMYCDSHNFLCVTVSRAKEIDNVEVWDMQTGLCIRELDLPQGIFEIALSKFQIIIRKSNDEIQSWDISAGRLLRTLNCGSRSGTLIVSSWGTEAAFYHEKLITIWDSRINGQVFSRDFTSEPINYAAFSDDGSRIVLSTQSSRIYVMDTKSKAYQVTFLVHAREHRPRVLKFSPDGMFILSVSESTDFMLWNIVTGQHQYTHRGHQKAISYVTFSSDGANLVSFAEDGTIRLWNTTTGDCLRVLTGHTATVLGGTISPDKQTLVSASLDQTVRVWDLSPGSEPHQTDGVGAGRVIFLASVLDGLAVVSVFEPCTVKIWDCDTGRCRVYFETPDPISSITCIPDGSSIALGLDSGVIMLHDVASGACQSTLKEHSKRICTVIFSSDQDKLVSGGEDGLVCIWQIAASQYQLLTVIKFYRPGKNTLAFSPDGRNVAFISTETIDRVLVWDMQAQSLQHNLSPIPEADGLYHRESYVAFSSDGRYVVRWSYKENIYIWDVQTGRSLQISPASWDRAGIFHMSFSPDSNRLLIKDGRGLFVWDIATLAPILRCNVDLHTPMIRFAEDGNTVIVGGEGGTTAEVPSEKPRLHRRLDIDNDWIFLHGEQMVWLPPEYRPRTWITQGDMIILGSDVGRVTFVRFPGFEPLKIM